MLQKHVPSGLSLSEQDLQTSSATCWTSGGRTSSTWETTSSATSSNRRSGRAGRRSWWSRSSPKSCKCGRRSKVRRRGSRGASARPHRLIHWLLLFADLFEELKRLDVFIAEQHKWVPESRVRLTRFLTDIKTPSPLSPEGIWATTRWNPGTSAWFSWGWRWAPQWGGVGSSGVPDDGVPFWCWCAGADPQDGHVLRSDGQPPAQRRQADAVRQPAGALRRPLLLHLPQPAALPLQLSLHGSSSPGQLLFARGFPWRQSWLSLTRSLFQMPHEVASQTSTDLSAELNFTKHYYEVDEKKKNEVAAVTLCSFFWVSCISMINKWSIISLSGMKMIILMKPGCSHRISPSTGKENQILQLNSYNWWKDSIQILTVYMSENLLYLFLNYVLFM